MGKKILEAFNKDIATMGDTVFGHWMPRMVVAGVDMNDVLRIRSTNPTWEQWPYLWQELGDKHQARGDAELAKGHTLTAGAAYRMANLAYHYGHFMLFDRPQLKRELMLKSMAVLDKGLPYQRYPGKRVYLPCDQWQIPCLLFELPDSQGRMVLLTGGADANKEEMLSFADVFLDRGLSVLIMDGPGQGEAAYTAPYRRATHKRFVDTVVDYMHSLGYDRLAVGGISMGGHFCPRAASINYAFKAAFGVGGPFDMRDLTTKMDTLFLGDFGHVMGTDDLDELTELVAKECSLADVIADLTCPLMIIHGDKDRICDYEQSHEIVEKSSSVEPHLIIIENGNHVCNNYVYLYRPVIADWLVEKL